MSKARLPVADIIHRAVVYSLAGISIMAIVAGVAIHRETMKQGRAESTLIDVVSRMKAAKEREKEEELKEIALAERAQAAFQPKKT
ncbi:hypothetical protein C8J56DRAFT_1059536 [Mycena floridula]|nr:hypothetical protein C8J56DRAFT_1059536 [Mycena floridula]